MVDMYPKASNAVKYVQKLINNSGAKHKEKS
jgi:hypothetical protein